jgi:ketosteroid isomerase-like protein
LVVCSLLLLASSWGGDGFSIAPGSDEARQAQAEIRAVLSGLESAFAAEDPDAVLALSTENISLGGNFMFEATGHAQYSTHGAAAVRSALSAYFADQGPSEYTFSLDTEPSWDGSTAVCTIAINIKDAAAVSGATSFTSHTWQDHARFVHSDSGWRLEQLSSTSRFHDEGTGISG